jgi:hypothetical protein
VSPSCCPLRWPAWLSVLLVLAAFATGAVLATCRSRVTSTSLRSRSWASRGTARVPRPPARLVATRRGSHGLGGQTRSRSGPFCRRDAHPVPAECSLEGPRACTVFSDAREALSASGPNAPRQPSPRIRRLLHLGSAAIALN